jgi:uncharacterized coiled-coil protein SlyX
MSDDVSEERFQRLESHVAELEHALDQMNTVLVEQGKLLRRLQAQCTSLSETLTAAELDRIRSVNPKPPHYQ